MRPLNPGQIFELAQYAYRVKEMPLGAFKELVRIGLPYLERTSLEVITATFGFMAQLNGGLGALCRAPEQKNER